MQTQSHHIQQFHSTIYEKYYNTSPQYNDIFDLMLELEKYLAKINFDPSMLDESSVEKLPICAQLRDCFEIGTKVALRLNRGTYFDTWINLLLLIYFNYEGLLSESIEKERIFCLYLLELICLDNYDDFYCMVEKIPLELQENGKLIRYALLIQKCLNCYDFRPIYEILEQIKSDVYCTYFIQPLLGIVRREQAATIKASYTNVSLRDIEQLLRFSTVEEAVQFINSQEGWILNNDIVSFKEPPKPTTDTVMYSMNGDLKNRLCTHLNRSYYDCQVCCPNDLESSVSPNVIMPVPSDYPINVVRSVEDYGNFINLFDSLL